MNEHMSMVAKFMDRHGMLIPIVPVLLGSNEFARQIELIHRQGHKATKMHSNGDIIGLLDALTDLDYANKGLIWSCGLGELVDSAFEEVHMANMTKQSLHIKGNNYKAPRLVGIVSKAQMAITDPEPKREQDSPMKMHREKLKGKGKPRTRQPKMTEVNAKK